MDFFLSYFFIKTLVAAVFAGIACGVVGVWVYYLNIPFVGVAMAHAAFAGAVIGLFFGINPAASAAVLCIAVSFFIGPLAEKGKFTANISTGIIFSFMLGLAFLFISKLKSGTAEALSLMWGSILTIKTCEVLMLAAISAVILFFLVVFKNGILSVIYSRSIASASGIPEKFIFYALLVLCALTVSLNIKTIGGLLIYSLITIPPAAAAQFSGKLKNMYILSSLFAVTACVCGLMISYLFNLPAGASIILSVAALFAVSFIFNTKQRGGYEKRFF